MPCRMTGKVPGSSTAKENKNKQICLYIKLYSKHRPNLFSHYSVLTLHVNPPIYFPLCSRISMFWQSFHEKFLTFDKC